MKIEPINLGETGITAGSVEAVLARKLNELIKVWNQHNQQKDKKS